MTEQQSANVTLETNSQEGILAAMRRNYGFTGQSFDFKAMNQHLAEGNFGMQLIRERPGCYYIEPTSL